ncbi:MAG: hypothetical protein M3067_08080 [Chloroflexota bacterium]|nr:hypothetical protein [Chloroflexota bacterium]
MPIATIDARELVGGLLTCGDANVFPANALEGPGGAELRADEAAAGLRAALADTERVQFPHSGWHLVAQSTTRVQFIARGAGADSWFSVSLVRGPAGWTLDLAGECGLVVVLGPGIGPAAWWLDPAQPRPGAKDRTFTALVLERACASGHSSDGRIGPPLVSYAPDTVTLIFGVRPRPGGQDCQGNPPGRYRVTLDQPLGDRQLLDGGSLPPRDATVAPDPPLGAPAGQPADGLERARLVERR